MITSRSKDLTLNLTQPLSRGMEQIILPTALVPQVGLVRSANMGRPETGNKLL